MEMEKKEAEEDAQIEAAEKVEAEAKKSKKAGKGKKEAAAPAEDDLELEKPGKSVAGEKNDTKSAPKNKAK